MNNGYLVCVQSVLPDEFSYVMKTIDDNYNKNGIVYDSEEGSIAITKDAFPVFRWRFNGGEPTRLFQVSDGTIVYSDVNLSGDIDYLVNCMRKRTADKVADDIIRDIRIYRMAEERALADLYKELEIRYDQSGVSKFILEGIVGLEPANKDDVLNYLIDAEEYLTLFLDGKTTQRPNNLANRIVRIVSGVSGK